MKWILTGFMQSTDNHSEFIFKTAGSHTVVVPHEIQTFGSFGNNCEDRIAKTRVCPRARVCVHCCLQEGWRTWECEWYCPEITKASWSVTKVPTRRVRCEAQDHKMETETVFDGKCWNCLATNLRENKATFCLWQWTFRLPFSSRQICIYYRVVDCKTLHFILLFRGPSGPSNQ